jgi:hypothetical protein
VIRAAAWRFLEDHEQRDHGKCRDHQQLIIVDVSDDLRLLRDHSIECGAAGSRQGIPELCDRRILERAVHCRDVLRDLCVVDLRVAGEQSINDRNADAGADIAREIVEAGAFGSLLGRQRGECHGAQRYKEKAEANTLQYSDDE